MKLKKCIRCGNNFVQKSSGQKYCSQKCKNYLYKKICVICKKEFESKNKNTKVCCRSCGAKYQYLYLDFSNKRKQTYIKKYGVDNPAKSEVVKNKYKQTMLKKYGVDNSFKVKSVKEKIKESHIKHFGCWNSKTKQWKEKIKITNNKKFGKDYYMQTEEFKIRNRNSKINKNTLKDFSSKLERQWLDFLNIPNVKYKNRQKFIGDYCVDGYKDGIIYEFLGDLWHGNPRNNYMTTRVPYTNKRKIDVFYETELRFNNLLKMGFKIIYCWEYDWNHKNNKYIRIFNGSLGY